MDVALSIIAGLGLRMFVIFVTGANSSNKLTIAVLGLWEGVVLHQLSGRSPSSNLDHFLAYGLRLTVDFLVSKNLQRIAMMVLWSVLGTFTSEALVPHSSLRVDILREQDRIKGRRHRHSRSIPGAVPILSTPLPPRVRAYKPPDPDQAQASITPFLSVEPPPDSSTPIFPFERPPTPPSFFLQENTSASPSPKPVQLQLQTDGLTSRDILPVRPRSGLASILDHSPNSSSPLHIPRHLPTPPDSAQTESAAPSDGLMDTNNETYHDNLVPRFDTQLYTIPEVSSPEDNVTPPESGEILNNNEEIEENQDRQSPEAVVQTTETANLPLPVPNPGLRRMPSKASSLMEWLSSQPSKTKPEPIFPNAFTTTSEVTHPLPVLLRHQEPLFQIETPTDLVDAAKNHVVGEASDQDAQSSEDSESDELRTPGARRGMDVETDNEHDHDPLLTPTQHAQLDQLAQQLSPLSLNVRSALDQDEFHGLESGPTSANTEQDNPARDIAADADDLQIPGSLSQNLLLQPPLPPSGPLFRAASPPPESPPPPSPSTILSDPSDASVLSTRVPNTLYKRADELRQKAREEENQRAKLDAQWKLAEANGRVMDALALKIESRERDAAAVKLHKKAARRFFVARNPLSISNEIDVHGLRPLEAFDRIERAIVKAHEEKRTTIRVIVGKGLHSVNQKPILKPTVQREMQRQRIPCEVDARNPGVLIITLPTS
ncbi:hypothetical protein CPB84DRAFT_1775126 [Gymnopilus junonius]|uniref:Smr domain-containing protein n=1 Tax=Gymnopilus junonius TaxID=109634 RepID=A0A9P5NRJ0_GYMJU|nr:hypothetical protein CPB84DRAFT_1775126 [Gymnopilus junonius]